MFQFFLNSIRLTLPDTLIKAIIILLPFLIPIYFIRKFWIIRFKWITLKFVMSQKNSLLEIKLPKEITKSPAAMEIFFSYFSQGGAGNYSDAFLDGRTRPWFSCELVSIGGEVKFFIWCSQAKFKTIIESQLYAQYPNIEIYEVDEKDDYTKKILFDTDKYSMFGVQYALTKPDPYPIKTYIDYGLDKDQKEEYKIDPMSSVIEYLGSLKKGENAWIQILVRKHEKEGWKHGSYKDGKDLKDEINKAIEEVRAKAIPKTDDENAKFPNPTKGQMSVIAAIERSAGKMPFDCMIRSIYTAEKDSFNPANIGGMVGGLRQYSSNDLNGFRPGFTTDVNDLQKDMSRIFPFLKKSNNKKILSYKKGIFHAYKLRSFFELPYKNFGGKPFVLTTEELATIFHFPSGMVTQTPTLSRIGSKKSEAPADLPI